MSRAILKPVPWLIMACAAWCITGCTHEEPRTSKPDHVEPNVMPRDTIKPNDSTSTHHTDTLQQFSIMLSAPRDYGYMGQTMQLTATCSHTATVSWASSNTLAATIDSNGIVTFSNTDRDQQTIITATANNQTDSLVLQCRRWSVAARNGNSWSAPAYLQLHQGDTLTLTLIDSNGSLINDASFNASQCTWTVTSRQADVTTFFNDSTPLPIDNGTMMQYIISTTAPTLTPVIIKAQHQNAASTLTITLTP